MIVMIGLNRITIFPDFLCDYVLYNMITNCRKLDYHIERQRVQYLH